MLNLDTINLSSGSLIKEIKALMLESVCINDTLTDKSILLSIVNKGLLTEQKSIMKELKKTYESTSDGKRFASSPIYKSIKTFEKRVAAKEFSINPFNDPVEVLKAYKLFCKENKASLQDCLTLAEKQAKTAEKVSESTESAESAESDSTESDGNEKISVSDFLKLIEKADFSESELKELVKGIDSLKSQKKAA